jgi:hypothetical protein
MLPTLRPPEVFFGRVYAAYGRVFADLSLAWGRWTPSGFMRFFVMISVSIDGRASGARQWGDPARRDCKPKGGLVGMIDIDFLS